MGSRKASVSACLRKCKWTTDFPLWVYLGSFVRKNVWFLGFESFILWLLSIMIQFQIKPRNLNLESSRRLRFMWAWNIQTEMFKMWGSIMGCYEGAFFLCWPASWVNPPSACDNQQGGQGQQRACLFKTLIVASDERGSPELVARHLLSLCVLHSQGSRELIMHLYSRWWKHSTVSLMAGLLMQKQRLAKTLTPPWTSPNSNLNLFYWDFTW